MNENKVIELLLKHDKNIKDIKWELQEKVAKKTDLERIYTVLDEILLLVKKNDQEITFMNQRITRLKTKLLPN